MSEKGPAELKAELTPVEPTTETVPDVQKKAPANWPAGVETKPKTFHVYNGLSVLALVLGIIFHIHAIIPKMDYEDMEDHEGGLVHFRVVNSILIILTGLVCVSLGFEGTQHYLEHNIHKQFLPVLNALNTELMGMGFLAIWVYFTLKSEILLDVGEATLCLQADKFMVHADSLERRLAGGPCASCWGAEGTAGCPGGHYRNSTSPWPAQMTGEVMGTGGTVSTYTSDAVILSHDNSGERRLLGSKVYEYSFEKAVMGYNVHTDIHTGRNLGANAGCPCCRGKPCHDWGGSGKGKCVPETGGHCDELIIHMFEDIHMSLFLVLCLFFIRVCLLMFQMDLIADDWEEMEHRMLMKGNKVIAEDFQKVMANTLSSVRERKDAQEAYEFMLLKMRFVDQMKGVIENPNDFSFSEYLTIEGGHVAQEIVEIPPVEWCALEVFFFVLWIGLRQASYMRVRFYLALSILGILLCVQLIGKMEWVLQKLVPEKKIKAPKGGIFSMFAKKGATIIPDAEEGGSDLHAEVPGNPEFVNDLKADAGHGHNPHHAQEALFLNGSEHLTLHLLRFFMLTSMIFFVLMITMIPFAESMGSIYLVLCILPAPPLALALLMVPHELLKDFTISTNVEFLKKPKTVAKVCRNIRIAKNLRALSILRALQTEVGCKSTESNLLSIDETKMDEDTLARFIELKRTFELFDLDKSGSVDEEELGSLMTALGINVEAAEKARVMKEFDKDNNGNICWQEFWTYMSRRNDAVDAKAVVHQVFDAIDADGSGSLTPEEFAKVLKDLGSDLSERDIDDLCREMDADQSGSISLEEFAEALEEYVGGSATHTRTFT